jgi:MgtC family
MCRGPRSQTIGVRESDIRIAVVRSSERQPNESWRRYCDATVPRADRIRSDIRVGVREGAARIAGRRPDALGHWGGRSIARDPRWRRLSQRHRGGITGVGFIGGGIVFRRAVGNDELISGITTAATILATTAIGATVGVGLVAVAALAAALVLISLEAPHIPFLRSVDARRWSPRFEQENGDFKRDDDTTLVDPDNGVLTGQDKGSG